MKLLINIDDKDYELLKKTAIEIDWDITWHGKEKDREMTFALFDLAKALKNGTPAEDLEGIISKFRNTAYRNGYITGLNKRPRNDWGKWVISEICCPNCFNYLDMDYYSKEELNKCPICGEDMWEGGTKE